MYRRTMVSLLTAAVVSVLWIAGLDGGRQSAKAAQLGQAAESARDLQESKRPREHTLRNEPGKSFHGARKSFIRQHYKHSAERLRKGASFIRLDARWATDAGRTVLTESANELQALSDRVERGDVKSVKVLDDSFARAHYALSKHYYLNATGQRAENQTTRLSRSLKACAMHLEDGFAWARQPVQGDAQGVIDNAESTAAKLEKGMSVSDDELAGVIRQLGAQVQRLESIVKPSPTGL